MSADPTIRSMLVLCTGILVLAALYFTRSILAPVAFSLFIIAVVWPLQSALQAKIPKLLALAVTILAILAAIAVLAFLIVWGFGRIGQWLINNVDRFQMLYAQAIDWLERHGVPIVSHMTENFNVSWLFRAFQQVGGQISNFASFAVITFVFTALGLLEVDIARKNIEHLESKEIGGVDNESKHDEGRGVRAHSQ
jgi:AI-2 transport protein TqsA